MFVHVWATCRVYLHESTNCSHHPNMLFHVVVVVVVVVFFFLMMVACLYDFLSPVCFPQTVQIRLEVSSAQETVTSFRRTSPSGVLFAAAEVLAAARA